MVTAEGIRGQVHTFELRLRGLHPDEVQAYLARIALIFEILGDDSGPLPAIPAEAGVDAIRRKEFTTVWRGFDGDQVYAYLDTVASELERRLARDQALPSTSVKFGSNLRARIVEGQASGLFRDAEIEAGSLRRTVTFCTPEGLTRDLAERLVGTDTCLVSDMIIVPEITVEAMKSAVDQLASAHELWPY